jgi:predicted DNA-binding transcriptional regulator YafY
MKNQKTMRNGLKSANKTRIARSRTDMRGGGKEAATGTVGVKRPAVERLHCIHGWLKAGEYPNCGRIGAEFEVDRKTALRDIEFLKDRMGMPIVYDDKRHGYFFDGPAPEFGAVALSERELYGLCFLGKVTERFRGSTAGKPLEALLKRVSRQLDDKERFTLQNLDDVMSVRPFASEDGDLDVFELVARGVRQQQVLRFQYRKPGERRSEARRVHPYHLMQHDNRWYLLAHDLARKAVRTFVLGRMREAALLDERFERMKDFDPKKILGGSLGVMAGKGDYQVVVEMDAWLTDMLRGRRWHPSQEVAERTGGGSELRMRLSGLEEIEQYVLSWGTHARVVGPPELVQRVARTARELVKQYGEAGR